MENGREGRATRDPRRQDRLMLVLAVVLTVAMFGWQGYHLYSAEEAASHQQTATLVEAVHSAGERQIRLVDDLEHDVLVVRQDIAGSPEVTTWPDRYATASAETLAATAAAATGANERLAGPVGRVEAARQELDQRVERVLQVLSTGDPEAASAALLDPYYLDAQAGFQQAVDGQIADLAADLEAKTAAERLTELHSVGIALVLFMMAIGAWAIFGRNLRRSRARLAREHERRLAAEAEAAQMQKMEALGMMADGIAHDVKNLTVVVLGSVDEVRRSVPDGGSAAAALTRIEEATGQADDLAKSLLAFSRKSERCEGALNLASLATGMTKLLRYMLPPAIELSVDAPAAAWVSGDPVQLRQVIFNLVANARDAMPDGGRLSVTIRHESPDAEQPAWLLEIRDTGAGMSADVVEHVFEPFFTTRSAGQGSGLGLAIVQRVVRDHGGWVRVATRPGEGTTFTIGLPAVPAPVPAVADPDRVGSLVIVANAAPNVRDLISGALVAEGHSTRCAATVEEVGACFSEGRPAVDLVVIDARLVGAAGLPVPPGIPVVLTGDAAAVPDLGGRADVILVGEPLSLAALVRSVADALRPSGTLVAS